MTTPTTPDVAPLAAFAASDVAAAGGKGANLGELIRAGLPVPEGFVVTTAAYRSAADRAGIGDLLAAGAEPGVLRAALLAVAPPAGLVTSIASAYATMGGGMVAVRSSATAEDLPGAAFAGQQDTVLGVSGAEGVMEAVRRCWASLWNDRAVAYRAARGIDPGEVTIAVVVQRLIDAAVAGVLFTADPVIGDRGTIVVDAGAGLGEAVVSGRVTPDHYLLNRRGRVRSWQPGRGEVTVRAAANGGVQESSPGAAGSALLDARTLALLAAHARRITDLFGTPQDIEWAVADGTAWILQARPMTALPVPGRVLGRIDRLQGAILAEYLPVRPYPMDVTTQLGRGPAAMMRDITRAFGIAGAFTDYLREEDGVVTELLPPRARPTLRVLATPAKLIRGARRHRAADWQSDPRQVAFLDEVAALEALDLAALPWRDLLEVPDRALATLTPCRDLRIDYLPGAGLAIARAVVIATLLRRRDLIADLLGGARTRTEDANDALAELGDMVRSDPGLRALTAAGHPGVELTSRYPGFAAALAAFNTEFGRRETVSPLLVSPPTLADSPDTVLSLVRAAAEGDGAGPTHRSRSAAALAALLRYPLVRSSAGLRRLVERVVSAAQAGVAFREDTHFYFTAALPVLRRALLEIGRRLAAVELLAEPAEVFHLRWGEVASLPEPSAIPQPRRELLRAAVGRRAARRTELAGVPMFDASQFFPARPLGDALVVGTPAGAGNVTGVARVVLGDADFERLGAGEVLVCPYTNPAWTPLFQRAAAVVVDSGSTASHAAIVAREYGLPAVMGTGRGTSVIADGQLVTVDGTHGTVTAADRAWDRGDEAGKVRLQFPS